MNTRAKRVILEDDFPGPLPIGQAGFDRDDWPGLSF